MIAAAVKYRQAEKNTPPDFSTNPPQLRNSVFCQKAPNNTQLNGLVQAQDPANDPTLFFDPATGATVTRGSQPNTFPFGTNGTGVAKPPANNTNANNGVNNSMDVNNSTVNDGGKNNTSNGGNIGDFGSCSVPKIDFGQGFDGRKETSFRPADSRKSIESSYLTARFVRYRICLGLHTESYPHGSAQNIDVITQSMCDQLVNTCKADDTARNTCANAKSAASSATPVKTGIQADAFNRVFGIITDFAKDPVFDDTGHLVSGSVNNGTNNDGGNNTGSNTGGNNANNSSCTPTNGGNNNTTNTNNGGNVNAGNIGDFGSCSVPEIEFGVGFDGRRETSFRPVDMGESNLCTPTYLCYLSQEPYADIINLGPSELQPRFGSEYRHYNPVHVRPTREHVQSRCHRSCHLRSS